MALTDAKLRTLKPKEKVYRLQENLIKGGISGRNAKGK